MGLDETSASTTQTWDWPDAFDGFDLVAEMGRGGSSIVYRARQPGLNREVALKVLLGGPWLSAASRSRFLLEARAVATLDHPHIVPVYGFGEAHGRPYLVMKLIQGGTLAGVSAQAGSKLPLERIARMMLQVARATQHAHDRGILHRDLKPTNVLVDAHGDAFVTDFGLARWHAEDAKLTASGVLMGTPAYASPEQTLGCRDVTTAADVWGLGCVLYELLAGLPPFEGQSVAALLRAIQEEEPVPPLSLRNMGKRRRSWAGQLENDLQVICLTCLRKPAEERYASAGAVADDLERCLEGRPILARPIGPGERAWRWCGRHPAWVVASASALVALVLLAVMGPLTAVRIAESRDEARIERARALRTVDRLETAAIMARLESHDGAAALAMLARRLRANPNSPSDADRVVSLLRLREFAVPIETSVIRPSGNDVVACVDGGHLISYRRDTGLLEGWDLSSRQRLWTGTNASTVLRIDGNSQEGCWSILDDSGQIELRALSNGVCRARADLGSTTAFAARFSHDGAWLVVGGYTNVASLWEVGAGVRRRAFLVHGPRSLARMEPATRVLRFDFDRESRRVATGGNDGMVQVWSVPEGQGLARFEHGMPVGEVRFHPNRPLLASIGGTRLRIWDLERSTMLAELDLWGSHGHAVAFGPEDGSLVFVVEDGLLGRWDFGSSPSLRSQLQFSQALGALFSLEEGSQVAVSTELGGLWWISTGDRQEVVGELPSLRSRNVREVPLWCRPDGREVVMQHRSGEIARWRLPARERSSRLAQHEAEVGAATFSPSGNRLATVAWNGEVQIWNLNGTSIEPGPTVRHGDRAWQARFSPDGSLLATSGWDSRVNLWDPETGEWKHGLDRAGGGVWWLEFVERGRRLLTAGSFNPPASGSGAWVEAWSLHGVPKRVFGPGTNGFAWTPALSPDGTRWVVPDRTDRVHESPVVPRLLAVYDTLTGKDAIPPLAMPVRSSVMEEINSTAYSPDGKWIAAGGVDHAVVWDARTGKVTWDLSHPLRVRSVCFHPDGRRFLTAGEDATARLWDLQTGTALAGAEVLRHARGTATPLFDGTGIKQACFSPDGRWIATAAADRTARLWDAATGLPVTEPLLHGGPVLHVGFSPDGTLLVTGSADGSARLWRVGRADGPIPVWLPDFLEALSRQRLAENDESVPVPIDAFFQVVRRARAEPSSGVWAEVLGPYLEAAEAIR